MRRNGAKKVKNRNWFGGLHYVFFITKFIPVLHVLAPLQLIHDFQHCYFLTMIFKL